MALKYAFENGYRAVQVFFAGLVAERHAHRALRALFAKHGGDDPRGLGGACRARAARRNADALDVERRGQLVTRPPRPRHVGDVGGARVAAVSDGRRAELLADDGELLL